MSSKKATASAILRQIRAFRDGTLRKRQSHIITIEDPIEFVHKNHQCGEAQARFCERRTPLLMDTKEPLTFEAAACLPNSLNVNALVLQHKLAFDANAFTAEDGILRAFLLMSIDFQRAGTLRAEVNQSWTANGTFCFVNFYQADSSTPTS